MSRCLERSPSHRYVKYEYLACLAPELNLGEYEIDARGTAFREEGYGAQIARRKGSFEDFVSVIYRVRFARRGLT